MKKHRSQSVFISISGFSLLELLFVVAIIATIAMFGLSTYRQRTINVKATRTAVEMQQILQAGSAFFIDKGEWPVAQTHTGDAFEKDYLPFGSVQKNPWEVNYDYQPFSGTLMDNKEARLFEVDTMVPTQGMATQIAARLPNSKVESLGDAYKVSAQVAVPGQNKPGEQAYLIVEIGRRTLDINKQSDQIKFNCLDGMEKELAVSLVSIEKLATEPQKAPVWDTFKINDPICNDEGCTFNVEMHYVCSTGRCWKPDAKISIQYIAYCKQKKQL